jgi:hypothetical protein
VLTLEKKKAVRKTVAGGATTTVRLVNELPETTSLSLDLYLLNKPLFQLVACTDPEVDTVEQWKVKAKYYSKQLLNFAEKLGALAA